MKKIIILIIFVVIGFLIFRFVKNQGIIITISKEDIQTKLKEKFPIDKNMIILNFHLATPEVLLKNGSDRLEILLKTKISILGKEYVGTTNVNGEINYNPAHGEFFFYNVIVKKMEISGISEKYKEKAEKGIGDLIKVYLDNFPVYKLKQEDYKQSLAKSYLKSVKVKNGKLVIIIGVNK